VIIENISIANSPGWTLHLFDCDVAKVDKVTIKNSLFGPNSDGIDITGSHDVSVSNCYISVGDDCIALKTTEDSRTCERITVTNCIFETNCVAFRVGFESRKDFKDITLSNCIVKNASRAIDLRTIEGGNIENVIVSGMTGQVNSGWAFDRVIEIQANRVANPYAIAIKEHPNYGKDKPVEKAGRIRNILIENMIIKTSGRILLGAIPETSISNVTFRDITLEYFLLEDPYETGLKAVNSVGFAKGMPFVRSQRAAIVAEGVTGLTVSNFKAIWPSYPVSESCFLLTSPNRLFNPSFFKGNEIEIKSGAFKVEFKPFAFKNVKQALIENSTSLSSEGNADFIVNENSEVKLK
ncbi:MAG: glycosyl hydrolase family 28 protein, partial [Paludibacter sp.]